jgi:hypothetical protein
MRASPICVELQLKLRGKTGSYGLNSLKPENRELIWPIRETNRPIREISCGITEAGLRGVLRFTTGTRSQAHGRLKAAVPARRQDVSVHARSGGSRRGNGVPRQGTSFLRWGPDARAGSPRAQLGKLAGWRDRLLLDHRPLVSAVQHELRTSSCPDSYPFNGRMIE